MKLIMNIEDIRKEKAKLKAAIIASSVIHIADFEAKTGLNIKAVRLDFIYNPEVQQNEGRYILGGITVDIDLQI